MKKLPTFEEANDRLRYDPATGYLIWKKPGKRCRKDGLAGTQGRRSYIGINGLRLPASRVAWLLVTGSWPQDNVDHVNGDPTDGRWENLREATQSQNMGNARNHTKRSALPRGVGTYNDGRRKCFKAAIFVNGKNIHLGAFFTVEDAAAAYEAASRQHFGEFSYFNRKAA